MKRQASRDLDNGNGALLTVQKTEDGERVVLLSSKDLELDFDRRLFTVRTQPVHLTPKEFSVLYRLVAHHGRPLPHSVLLREVWGPNHADGVQLLRIVINQLRKKIELDPASPEYITTEPWVGYRFVLPPDARVT